MSDAPVSPAHRRLLAGTAAMSFLLVAMGSVVCVTDASGGCPDWPRCHGQLVPPAAMDSILEYAHRVVAVLTGPLLLAAVIVGWRRREPSLRVLPRIAVVLAAAAAVFGAFTVLTGISPLVAALDLASALGVVALMTISAVVASAPAPVQDRGPGRRSPVAAWAIASLAAMSLYFVAGVPLAQGTLMRCVGGPIQSPESSAMTSARTFVGGLAAMFVFATVARALISRSTDARTRRWSLVAGALLVVEATLAVVILTREPGAPLLIASAVASVALFCSMVVVAAQATLSRRHATFGAATGPVAAPASPGKVGRSG